MKILLIGSGGREQALAYSLKKSKLLSELKVFPGNGGFETSEVLPSGSFNLKDKASVQQFVKNEKFTFVVVGPEDPLVDGISDWIQEIGIPCFGPSAYCARIEGSKNFAKELMSDASVPTAAFARFTEFEAALAYVKIKGIPIVVKADGLAAGKGVTVCETLEQAEEALKDIFIEHKFGKSGSSVVIEEFMEGEEASIFAFCDGNDFLMFPAAQDHKRAYEGDRGPNTGGMGAYAPAPVADEKIYKQVAEKVFRPVLEEFKKRGNPYRGLLYAGLMISPSKEVRIVEFNCRFGDPETQALLLLLESDILEIMLACANGDLKNKQIKFKEGFSSVVVYASEGYPGSYSKGLELKLPASESPDTLIFHAGTKRMGDKLVSDGGRVLGITSYAKELQESLKLSYSYLEKLDSKGFFFRKDIGHRVLKG
ncbi:MAG: phosphoribosylamine--glycine ligase [Leptospiraceae bacterium]|nr:phosphoribosylamine--glycine ligase [Leptospiraceae bacterium]MCP5498460.1 phosphoribosylamine--glycine ligase [Leptospiraceae bacterium]